MHVWLSLEFTLYGTEKQNFLTLISSFQDYHEFFVQIFDTFCLHFHVLRQSHAHSKNVLLVHKVWLRAVAMQERGDLQPSLSAQWEE